MATTRSVQRREREREMDAVARNNHCEGDVDGRGRDEGTTSRKLSPTTVATNYIATCSSKKHDVRAPGCDGCEQPRTTKHGVLRNEHNISSTVKQRAMLDTGCERMVCGLVWYLGFLNKLKRKFGIVPIEFEDT